MWHFAVVVAVSVARRKRAPKEELRPIVELKRDGWRRRPIVSCYTGPDRRYCITAGWLPKGCPVWYYYYYNSPSARIVVRRRVRPLYTTILYVLFFFFISKYFCAYLLCTNTSFGDTVHWKLQRTHHPRPEYNLCRRHCHHYITCVHRTHHYYT